MKKFLLSALLLGAGAGAAMAQSFDVYISTKLEKSVTEDGMELFTPVDYQKVTEGQTVEVGLNRCELYTDGGYYQVAEIMAYTRIVNNTSAPMELALSYTNPGALTTNASELGSNIHVGNFVTCVGGMCVDANPLMVSLGANGETDSRRGEHMGYEAECEAEGLLGKLDLDATYNFTAKAGSDALNFTLHYKVVGDDSSVSGIEAADAPAVYYNMQGMPVANPEVGQIYIKRQGDKVIKVIR